MSDSKVYMFPESGYDRGTDTALLASMIANNNRINDPMAAMAMMGGGGCGGFGGGMWNNPIWAIVFLAALQNGGLFGFGGNRGGQGLQDVEIQGQLSAIREQLSTNQNTGLLMDAIKGNGAAVGQLANAINCDFNAVQSAINSVQAAICNIGSKVDMDTLQTINAINSGNAALASQLSQCCCDVREAITRQGYENQLATVNQTNTLQNALNFVNSSVERGFASTNYETAQQTCAIEKAIENSTAQILAGQRAAEMRELQREIQSLRDEKSAYQMSALSQQQTQTLVNQLRPCPIPAYITCNPFGCQSDNYPYGVYNGGSCGC